jgi:glycine cleavage system H lipoate-binding protein
VRCPFLREAHVQSCQASPFRKQIVRTGTAADERCGSSAWRECAVVRELNEEHPSASACPFHSESLAQYCSAAPVTKLIPWSDQAFSRCGSEAHRYCDLYLALARTPAPPAAPGEPAPGVEDADGVPVPQWLWFAPGHTWLAIGGDGVCHIGVDAFLARTLGGIDRVQFVTTKGVERPAAVLTVREVDLTVTFPNPVLITGVNGALRADPARLARDPYGLGWLFEGVVRDRGLVPGGAARATEGLFRGDAATAWMRRETLRLRALAEDAAGRISGARLAADGGLPAPGLVRTLPHDEALRLSHLLLSNAPDEERFP